MSYRYSDPISDHYAYTNDLYLEQKIQQEVADEMHLYKEEALARLRLIVHPDYLLQFAEILLLGWSEETKEAEKIAKDLNLSQKHFVAIGNDEKGMRQMIAAENVEYMY